MKTITYRGKEYEVEDWVNFVAMDDNGEIFGYEHRPIRSMTNKKFFNALGDVTCIGVEPADWENSLEKV